MSGWDDCFSENYMRMLEHHYIVNSGHTCWIHTSFWITQYIVCVCVWNIETIIARSNRPYFNIPIVYSSGPVTTSYWQKITSILVSAIAYVIPLYKRIYFAFSAPLVIQLIWRAWNRCHTTDNIVAKITFIPHIHMNITGKYYK